MARAKKGDIHGNGQFEVVIDDTSSLRCVTCSHRYGHSVILKKTSLSRHLKSSKHEDSLKADQGSSDASQAASATLHPDPASTGHATVPANLHTIDQFMYIDNGIDSPADGPDSLMADPFSEAFLEDGIYVDTEGLPITFSAGGGPSNRGRFDVEGALREAESAGGANFADLVSTPAEFESILEPNPGVSEVFSTLEAMGFMDLDDEDENETHLPEFDVHAEENNPWRPYPNKAWFMVDLMDHQPRTPISDEQLKLFLWVMKECQTPGVPGFRPLRTWQAKRAQTMGFKPTHHVTALNNEYYANHPADLFRFNFANPLIRPHMSLYPEVAEPISEFFHTHKMLAMDDASLDLGQLMWAEWDSAPQRHFYIKELARLQDGRFVVPLRWITVSGVESFDGLIATYNGDDHTFCIEPEGTSIRIPARGLRDNCLDLMMQGYELRFKGAHPAWAVKMPHPVREVACNSPTITVRMMPWSDDVSGNRTKQYNAHTNVYMANTNLPHAKLQQEYFIQFVSTSQYASSSEQMRVIAENTGPNVWHRAYDCVLEQEVLFRIIPHILPADNPQQAEHCSHMTGKGSRPCRRCEVGGSAVECEQEGMYELFFSGGSERTVDGTIRDIREQLLAACLGVQDAVDQLQTKTGVKDKIAQHWIDCLIPKSREIQTVRISQVATRDVRLRNPGLKGEQRKEMKESIKKEIQAELFQWLIEQPEHTYNSIPEDSSARTDIRPGDHYNSLLSVPGLDVHRDTPCEILHTYLLGVDKYIWHKMNSEWDKKSEQLFAVRLRASTIDGLTITSLLDDFILRYPNSLLGKHFKILQQLAVFHLYDGVCPALVFDLWKATGELGAILWFHKIDNLEQYLEDLKIYIANVLDIWATIDPNRIIVKQKLHVLVHLVEDIRRHGPAVLYSTEIFECWNAIFRLCSVYSNHHGASHDIARRMAGIELFKHQVSGGWWPASGYPTAAAATGAATADAAVDSQPHQPPSISTELPLPSSYVRAGENVRLFLQQHPALQRRLGWVSPLVLVPGSVKLMSLARQAPSTWLAARGSSEIPVPIGLSKPSECLWYRGKYLVARSRDICKPNSWIFYCNKAGDTHAGRINRILSCPEETRTVAIIDKYSIDAERDDHFNMPVLYRACDPEGQGKSTQVPVESIMFIFNAQHDCRTAKCTRIEDQRIMQERKLTARTRESLVHEPIDRYLVNMHALHNAALIRGVLPRELTAPIAYVADRQAHHNDQSAAMRITGPLKRAGAQAKAAETRARNKSAKDAVQPGIE